jgi:bifunctional non-homologous end joining protein LigD
MKAALKSMIQRGDKSPMPTDLSPMLCTLVKSVPDNAEFVYEIKWDGYRIISFVNGSAVRLDSRGGKNYSDKYPPVVKALQKLKSKLVLDGEVVVFNDEGIPDFNAVQNYNGHGTPISYYLFDIVWIDGYSLKRLPLYQRREILKQIIRTDPILRISETFPDGKSLYKQMEERGLEGVVAKVKDSEYAEGQRGNQWLKIPTRIRQEFVIGGWAESEKSRSFRSILFGAYNDKGDFEWIGRSGGGYKEKEMPAILDKLKKVEIKSSPFVNPVLDTKGAVMHWTRPRLVANFEFAAWTPGGRIRKPATFLGFRNDKAAGSVVREIPKQPAVKKEQPPKPGKEKRKAGSKKHRYLNSGSNWKLVDEEQQDADWTSFEMQHCTVPVHKLDRELWKGVTKGELLLYYTEIADILLPHIKDRPQSLVLKLINAGASRVFIKDMENRQPECAEVFSDRRRVKKEGKRNIIDYLVCNNKETLVYLIDLGCVDINVWASRINTIEEPDYIWVDLDPTIPSGLKGDKMKLAEDDGFKNAVRVAKAAKQVLDKYKLKAFVKTSGQTGLHIYIPCSGFSFVATRQIATALAGEIHSKVPSISTVNESINSRGNKVYIDAGQNDYADTLAAPYSVRPYHQPIISTPLKWTELTNKLDRYAFTIESVKKRLKKYGDLFEAVMDPAIQANNNRRLEIFLETTS